MISSFCTSGTCVDVEIVSSFCSDSMCVTVKRTPHAILVTDTFGNTCTYTVDEWTAFVKGVKNSEFDIEGKDNG